VNIWLTGLYSEVCHFLLSCLLAWVVLRLIFTTLPVSFSKWSLILSIALAFGIGGLVHLVADIYQSIF